MTINGKVRQDSSLLLTVAITLRSEFLHEDSN